MDKKILIRFGDLMLKGKNIKMFTKRIIAHIKFKLRSCEVAYVEQHDRLFIVYPHTIEEDVMHALDHVPGIASYSVVHETTLSLDDIIDGAIQLIQEEIHTDRPITFKIETKRANKHFPWTSLETTQKVASRILSGANRPLVIDVHDPEETLTIEIRNEAAYLFLKKHEGLGGYPAGSGDHALLMISGGIDSPVAAHLALKQGLKLDLIHFESTPMTSLESAQKVVDLAKVLANYTIDETITLHMVPFKVIHETILKEIPEPYHITIMRRMMYLISERFALTHGMHGLINGESIGQVASQTLQSLRAVEAVTKLPILRPLITTNKSDIVHLAKKIGTYDISIRPFEDCCSIYVPKQPATKPRDYIAIRYEQLVDFESLIDQTMQQVLSIVIQPSSDLVLYDHGFSVDSAYQNYMKQQG